MTDDEYWQREKERSEWRKYLDERIKRRKAAEKRLDTINRKRRVREIWQAIYAGSSPAQRQLEASPWQRARCILSSDKFGACLALMPATAPLRAKMRQKPVAGRLSG